MSKQTNMELRKFVAPEIIEGLDARLLVDRYISHFISERPMIVTDKNLTSLAWFQEIVDLIAANTESYCIFDEVSPNPKDYEVMRGSEMFLANACDLIIAIGGGSPLDCAKGISIVATNGGHILDYVGVDQVSLPGPPMICLPTTAGTSADISQFAIILDSDDQTKKAIISKMIVPDLALIDPIPLLDMPPYLRACTGMDALTHAIEAYVSTAQSPLTDAHALSAIRIINRNIIPAVQEDNNLEATYNMMLGSLHAGLAFSNASLGLVHAMAHALGGLFDLPHGECNAILLGDVIDYNFESAPERYRMVATMMYMDVDSMDDAALKEALLDRIAYLSREVGIKDKFEIACSPDELDQLVEKVLEDPCVVTNPREASSQEVTEIYEKLIK